MRKKTLQTLLNHRELLEKLAQEALFKARQQEAEIVSKIHQMEQKADTLKQDCDLKKTSGINILELQTFEKAISLTLQKTKDLKQDLAQHQEKVLECQKALTKASQEKTLMEKLLEKKMAELKKKALRQEMKDIDEVASNHHRRDP